MPLKLVARPDLGAVQVQETYVCFRVRGEAPGPLPRGMPGVPSQQPVVWLVVLARPQWEQALPHLAADPTAAVTLVGTPVLAEGRAVLLAHTCAPRPGPRASAGGGHA